MGQGQSSRREIRIGANEVQDHVSKGQNLILCVGHEGIEKHTATWNANVPRSQYSPSILCRFGYWQHRHSIDSQGVWFNATIVDKRNGREDGDDKTLKVRIVSFMSQEIGMMHLEHFLDFVHPMTSGMHLGPRKYSLGTRNDNLLNQIAMTERIDNIDDEGDSNDEDISAVYRGLELDEGGTFYIASLNCFFSAAVGGARAVQCALQSFEAASQKESENDIPIIIIIIVVVVVVVFKECSIEVLSHRGHSDKTVLLLFKRFLHDFIVPLFFTVENIILSARGQYAQHHRGEYHRSSKGMANTSAESSWKG